MISVVVNVRKITLEGISVVVGEHGKMSNRCLFCGKNTRQEIHVSKWDELYLLKIHHKCFEKLKWKRKRIVSKDTIRRLFS